MSQAENAGTVTSGDAADQAAAGGEEVGRAGLGAAEELDGDSFAEAEFGEDEIAEEPEDFEEAEDEEADTGAEAGDPAAAPVDLADLEQQSEIAADYVEGLLDVADLDGDIDMDVEGDRALVSVVGTTLQELIGTRGEVLEALQELTRLAVHRQTGARTRIMLDVGGYRARRRVELTELGREIAEEVSSTGEPKRLSAMTPFERKIVHDAVAAAGLRSESEGEEPNRRVVVFPAG